LKEIKNTYLGGDGEDNRGRGQNSRILTPVKKTAWDGILKNGKEKGKKRRFERKMRGRDCAGAIGGKRLKLQVVSP